jgi:hypothetical protein
MDPIDNQDDAMMDIVNISTQYSVGGDNLDFDYGSQYLINFDVDGQDNVVQQNAGKVYY